MKKIALALVLLSSTNSLAGEVFTLTVKKNLYYGYPNFEEQQSELWEQAFTVCAQDMKKPILKSEFFAKVTRPYFVIWARFECLQRPL